MYSSAHTDDKTLHALQQHSDVILQRLQTRAVKTDSAAMQHVKHATCDDVMVRALSTQGLSRKTYEVRVGDYQAVLTVFAPTHRAHQRTEFENRLGFRRALREVAIPVPGKIGTPFDIAGIEGHCELTEFQRGYQKPRGSEFTARELQSLGDALGRMHGARNFKPRLNFRTFKQEILSLAKGLPYGFIHNDFIPGNYFFDDTTSEVSGVIDFEWSRRGPLVNDLVNCLRTHAIDVTKCDAGIKVKYNPEKAKYVVRAYEMHRQLGTREIKEIKRKLPKWLAIEEQCLNELVYKESAVEDMSKPTSFLPPVIQHVSRLNHSRAGDVQWELS